ncbi:hypothetical protein RHGRI_025780 [Rhododendron griersonianum]|uniref:ABI3-interacting protein 2 n=1 Tax=Rhododendron griersonianum TaxID=479676 RepID=A0AAV6ITY7_9ERIC|nr:hypothetical protein RHGRI_025780 [Rhododendron griersonianum]
MASAMLEDDLDPTSPNSLASYQSGLLEAMLVEQGGVEGSSSPMELSTQEAESRREIKQEVSEPVKESSTVQFRSMPEVQINMVYPCPMIFPKKEGSSSTQGDSSLSMRKLEITEVTSSEDELNIICNNCDLEEVAQMSVTHAMLVVKRL